MNGLDKRPNHTVRHCTTLYENNKSAEQARKLLSDMKRLSQLYLDLSLRHTYARKLQYRIWEHNILFSIANKVYFGCECFDFLRAKVITRNLCMRDSSVIAIHGIERILSVLKYCFWHIAGCQFLSTSKNSILSQCWSIDLFWCGENSLKIVL